MRNAFAPTVRARPCPIFGRPVRLRGRPHRLQPDTSPHALRIPDRSGHPALRDIPSSWLKVCLGCVRLSPSCPFRLLHTRLLSRPARRYPRFRIRPSSSERRGDFNPHDSRAAQRTLRVDPSQSPASVLSPRGFRRLCFSLAIRGWFLQFRAKAYALIVSSVAIWQATAWQWGRPEMDSEAFATWLVGIRRLDASQRSRAFQELALAEAN